MNNLRGLHGKELKEFIDAQQPYVKLRPGRKINYWTIISSLRVMGNPSYECQCDCGEMMTIDASIIHKGRSKCCDACWKSGKYPELYLNEEHTTSEERERYVRCARLKNERLAKIRSYESIA